MDRKKKKERERDWHIYLCMSPCALRGELKQIHVPNVPQWGIVSDLFT